MSPLQLDRALSLFFNSPARHLEWLDQTMVVASNSDLIKGGAVLAIFWGTWSRERARRDRLLTGLAGSLIALFLARVLSYVLPHRPRPLLDPAMHFLAPIGLPDQSNWTNWSSFPSDHAALFFAIATGIWLANWRAGLFAFFYILCAICLPRFYVGIHYPSDVIAGAAIGVGAVAFLMPWRNGWTTWILLILERYPGWGCALFFLLIFQIATLFWDLRIFLSYFGFDT